MTHTPQPLPYAPGAIPGISEKTMAIHHDKLYAGYVAKRNEIETKVASLTPEDLAASQQTWSVLRGLSEGETFAANGQILHEVFFGTLGEKPTDPPTTAVGKALAAQFGSWEAFTAQFAARAMVARGWAILAYDPSDTRIHIYTADAQNQGGVWGATPLAAIDVYEHAYFADYGSDRASYVKAVIAAIDWPKVDARYSVAIRP